MKEKERYEQIGYESVLDHGVDPKDWNRSHLLLFEVVKILNEQDKRIKELEEENGYVVFVDGYDCNNNEIHRQEFIKYKDKCSELIEKTKRLKQLQKHLVKAVLDEVYNELICRFAYFVANQDSAKIDIDAEEFTNILVKIEKKYKGE